MIKKDLPRFEMPDSMNVYTGKGGPSRSKKLGTFAVGLAAGALALANWRTIMKKGLPLGLKLRTAVVRSAEDLADMIKEAQAEYAATAETRKDKPPTS
jgi:hypothetical protein